MFERLYFLEYKLPSFLVGTLIMITSLFMLLFAQGCIKATSVQSQTANDSSETTYFSNNPNAVAAGTEEAIHALGQVMHQMGGIAHGGLLYVASSTVQGGKMFMAGARTTVSGIGTGLAFIARGIGSGLGFVVNTVVNTVAFVVQIPINLLGLVSDTQVLSAVIEPATHSQVPIIDPNDPALLAAKAALPAVAPTSQPQAPVQEAIWPIHGRITTQFGEKGRFYKVAHTGIDISDGNRSGVTPVKAFRRGKVITATRNSGLGNHVIVDHGSGITSVYGHLSSISVQIGQDVDTSTTLGLQGSTGVSTGPHVHFEIRVNDQAADPRNFITGQP